MFPWTTGRTGRNRDDAYEVMLGQAGTELFLAIFNWSDARREYRFTGWGANGAEAALVSGDADLSTSDDLLRVSLAGRNSIILRLGGSQTFDDRRKALEVFSTEN